MATTSDRLLEGLSAITSVASSLCPWPLHSHTLYLLNKLRDGSPQWLNFNDPLASAALLNNIQDAIPQSPNFNHPLPNAASYITDDIRCHKGSAVFNRGCRGSCDIVGICCTWRCGGRSCGSYNCRCSDSWLRSHWHWKWRSASWGGRRSSTSPSSASSSSSSPSWQIPTSTTASCCSSLHCEPYGTLHVDIHVDIHRGVIDFDERANDSLRAHAGHLSVARQDKRSLPRQRQG